MLHDGDHYLILVLNASSSSMTEGWMKENLSFLCSLEWKVIFDFDAKGEICEFFQRQCPVKITMSDEFDTDSDKYGKDDRQWLIDDIKHSVQPSWIFANGHGNTEPLPPVQWKRNRSDSFKKAVQFFGSEIPRGRATVVFLLFSEDIDIILEAADEFFMRFTDNWLCVAESSKIGGSWTKELKRRNCDESPEERTVAGLSWGEVNKTVTVIKPVKRQTTRMIASSRGIPVILDPATINELTDFAVLGYNECEDEYKELARTERESLVRDEETKFYRGRSPSWWNFFFEKQVCHRDIHDDLRQLVRESLNSTSNDRVVDEVCILHQPGAGGTTSAKHILWDLRNEYRVAAVHSCEEYGSLDKIRRLAKQILDFYQYEELEDTRRKPVLLLLDKPELETKTLLYRELKEMAKRLRHYSEQNRLVCVFLVCSRLIQIESAEQSTTTTHQEHQRMQQSKRGDKNVSLRHILSQKEWDWFQGKYKELQKKFKEASQNDSVDPRLLISLNIMKENFDKDFIQRMVKEFVADITDENERKLLKYISLVNVYDLKFRPLPLSAFDNMMVKVEWVASSKKNLKVVKMQKCLWETSMSDALHILMNESSERGFGYYQSLRLINPLMAEAVLKCLRERSADVETVCDVALEFFNCKEVFAVDSCSRERLQNIVKEVLNKRRRDADGRPVEKFSPLIEDIIKNDKVNGAANACKVLEEFHKLMVDPFIAQTLARLFIEREMWDEAFKFAKYATDILPRNSYLWDTCGCVYEKKLLAERGKYKTKTSDESDATWLARVMQLGMDGIEVFRRVQELSELEQEQFYNTAGYYGELRVIINVLKCHKCVHEFHDDACLRQFLMEDDYVPQRLSQLTDINGHNYVEEIKKLKENVASGLHYIEDEMLQLRGDTIGRYDERDLEKRTLYKYFGEDRDDPPEGLSEQKKCNYRLMRIFNLVGNSMKDVFQLRWKDDGVNQLAKIRHLVSENIRSSKVEVVNYVYAISVDLALRSVIHGNQQLLSEFSSVLQEISSDDIVQWSLKLYNARGNLREKYLEPYLFLTLFNWPRENPRPALVAPHVIETALKEWKDAYDEKYPRQRNEENPFRKKATTMFFLANGKGIESVYTWYEEQGFERTNDSTFWKEADAAKNLQRFKGIVSSDGRKVEYSFEGSTLHIPTSFPLDRLKCNQKVVFIIGCSWMGPKAFDVRLPSSPGDFENV